MLGKRTDVYVFLAASEDSARSTF